MSASRVCTTDQSRGSSKTRIKGKHAYRYTAVCYGRINALARSLAMGMARVSDACMDQQAAALVLVAAGAPRLYSLWSYTTVVQGPYYLVVLSLSLCYILLSSISFSGMKGCTQQFRQICWVVSFFLNLDTEGAQLPIVCFNWKKVFPAS